MASQKVRGITIELGADTSGLSKALKDVNKEIGQTQKDLKDVERLLKLDPGNTELLAQKQRLLNDQIGETKTKLDSLKQAQSQVDMSTEEGQRQYDALQREIVSCEQELKNLQKEAGEANVAVQKIAAAGEKLKDLGSKVAGVGDKLTTHVSAPIAAAGIGAVKVATDWESAFAGVMKTVDETATTTYADLEKAIGEMTQRTASSRETIAGVMEIAGQLGVSADNIVGFTETMVKLGDTTNLSAEEAASAIAKFANVTGMSINDADKLGAVIVDLGNNYATTEADIVSMATRLSGAGAQIGLTDAQILGLATALSSVGIEAEMGGSAMSKAMVKMQVAVETGFDQVNKITTETGMSLRDLELMSQNDTKGFKELAGSLGMTKGELQAVVTAGTNLTDFAEIANMDTEKFVDLYRTDAPAALQAFISGLGDTEGQGESTIAMLQDMGFTEVRLRDTLTRLANSQGLVTDAMTAGETAWNENIALNDEAQKRYDTTASKNVQLQEKIKGVAIEIGDKLLPKVLEFMEMLSDLIDKYDALDDSEKDAIITIAGVVAAIGPLLSVGGRLISGIGSIMTHAPAITGAFSTIATFITGTAIPALGSLVGAIAPVIAAAAPFIAAAGLVVAAGILVVKNWDEIKEAAKLLVERTKEHWEEFKQKFEELGQKIAEKVNDIKQKFSDMKQGIADRINDVKTKLNEFKQGWEEKINAIKNKVNDFQQTVSNKFNGIKDSVVKCFDGIKNGIKSPINAALGFVEKFINNMIDGFNKLGSKIGSLEFDVPDWVPGDMGGKHFKLGLPELAHVSLPRLASGGIMTSGSAIVGEAGPELLSIRNGQSIVQPLGGQQGASELQGLLETYLPYLAMRQNILLDGDKLVGQTAGRMNEALGTISLRSART